MQTGKSLFSVAVLCLMALPLAAQNASLAGTARDPQQAAMPGVTITLTNLDTGVALTTETDATGNYEFPFVKPGRYSLKAEQKGFQTFLESQLALAVAERVRLDPAMQLGEASTLVTVAEDRKSTRLNSSHLVISNAVFC